MKLDSKLFDRIRVKPDTEQVERGHNPLCEWEGCERAAPHRAPKGRGREGQFHHFCIDHVRDYNKSYNYFSGMPDDAVAAYLKDALTGHRPTWTMGVNRAADPGSGRTRPAGKRHRPEQTPWDEPVHDPFGIFHGARAAAAAAPVEPRVPPLARKAFDTLGLEPGTDKVEIKSQYKTLVKRHHPDANGGDRSTEERLRQIIQAYNYLKSAGFC